jgi:G3E family GTPase
MQPQAHFIFLGGFLGAGKTTAALRLAEFLHNQGLRVGMITNDQGRRLVDTAAMQSRGLPTEEIAGGCFCCQFDALLGAAGRLGAAESPEVFIAEAVGSCTDLVATVAQPLRRLHGDRYTVAPLSVLVDPEQARRVLGPAGENQFSDDVTYVFGKQLEEADVIVVNKADQLDATAADSLRAALAARYPRAQVLVVSALAGMNLAPWFDHVLRGRPAGRPALEIDYDRYARGEARLGWFNAVAELSAEVPFNPDALLLQLATTIQARVRTHGIEVAHLKMSIEPAGAPPADLAMVNLVRTDAAARAGARLDREISRGTLLLNLRAEGAPADLQKIVHASLEVLERSVVDLRARLVHVESFHPGRPNPTHRDPGPIPVAPL